MTTVEVVLTGCTSCLAIAVLVLGWYVWHLTQYHLPVIYSSLSALAEAVIQLQQSNPNNTNTTEDHNESA